MEGLSEWSTPDAQEPPRQGFLERATLLIMSFLREAETRYLNKAAVSKFSPRNEHVSSPLRDLIQ